MIHLVFSVHCMFTVHLCPNTPLTNTLCNSNGHVLNFIGGCNLVNKNYLHLFYGNLKTNLFYLILSCSYFYLYKVLLMGETLPFKSHQTKQKQYFGQLNSFISFHTRYYKFTVFVLSISLK